MNRRTMPSSQGFASTREYFDWVADNDRKARAHQRHFHEQLAAFHRHHIPEGSRVLDCGCRTGELLRALKPRRGLGIDLSDRMVELARQRSGGEGCEFRQGDVQAEALAEKFDYIVMSFLAGYLTDIEKALKQLRASAHSRTRLVLTSLNHVWLWPLRLGQWLGWVMPQPPSNWLSMDDLIGLLELAGWEVVKTGTIQLLPVKVPLLTGFMNRFLVRLPFFRGLGITQTIIARPRRPVVFPAEGITTSVIIPVRNEAGNIRPALERVPVLGDRTEIVFVEGNSTDDTWEVVQREVAAYQGPLEVVCTRQPGRGKWDAVRTGFAMARGGILVIQDGDLTAPPEDLPKFYEAIVGGAADFANGSRLVYPMEGRAMRFLNFLGNKFFALALSYVLEQPVKDSLCGTKMILRSDYERLLERIRPFGNFDPFGDFNLLFGASLLDLKIRDIPVRYKDRTYGETNISRFSHGWMLLKMVWFGLRKLKWV